MGQGRHYRCLSHTEAAALQRDAGGKRTRPRARPRKLHRHSDLPGHSFRGLPARRLHHQSTPRPTGSADLRTGPAGQYAAADGRADAAIGLPARHATAGAHTLRGRAQVSHVAERARDTPSGHAARSLLGRDSAWCREGRAHHRPDLRLRSHDARSGALDGRPRSRRAPGNASRWRRRVVYRHRARVGRATRAARNRPADRAHRGNEGTDGRCTGTRASYPKLRDNLQPGDPDIPGSVIYAAVVRACGQLEDRTALESVLQASNDFDPYVRAQSLEALKRIDPKGEDARSRSAAREALNDPRESNVRVACQLVLQYRDSDATSALRHLIETRPDLAATAYDTLRQLGQ